MIKYFVFEKVLAEFLLKKYRSPIPHAFLIISTTAEFHKANSSLVNS